MSEINTSDIIKMMMSNTDLSQSDIAKKAHITEVSMSRYVNGKREPSFQTMQSIVLSCGFKLSIHKD